MKRNVAPRRRINHVAFQYPQPRVYAMKLPIRSGVFRHRRTLSVPSTSGLRDETGVPKPEDGRDAVLSVPSTSGLRDETRPSFR